MDWLNTLTDYAQTGASVYGSVTGKGGTASTVAAPAPTVVVSSSPDWQKYLPFGIGAFLLVVVIILVKGK